MAATVDSAATEIGPLKELSTPSFNGLRVCAKSGGAAKVIAAAAPPANTWRRDAID
jgi:hypothetical protein